MKKLPMFLVCAFLALQTLVLSAPVIAEDLTLEQIIQNIQSNQSKIKDMYAETTTTITSNMVMPGQESQGPQKMVQKARMWTKGKTMSKTEMLSPQRQITITNGDLVATIYPETGRKDIQDLSKLKGQGAGVKGQEGMDLEKAKEFFDLSASTNGNNQVITGIPKKDNKFLGKMEFYVDSARWIPVKIYMYGPKGNLMSKSEIEYRLLSDIWTPVKNISNVTTPMGKMDVEMVFENTKINQGIDDKVFAIE